MPAHNRRVFFLSLNRLQRLLLYGSATLWFLILARSLQTNVQDDWILDGLFWPFMLYLALFVALVWGESDNRMVAALCGLTLVAGLLAPSLKYTQVYGQAIDAVVHYQMVNDLVVTGQPSTNIYRAIAGMHSWLASLAVTGGMTASQVVKLGFPLAGCLYPLLIYWMCARMHLPADLTKYTLVASCMAAYPAHSLTGTGFTLQPLLFLMTLLLAREFYSNSDTERFTFTVLALLTLVQITVWHSTTPMILLLLLVSVAFTPAFVWWLSGRKTRLSLNWRFVQMSLVAGILILGYHALETDRVFTTIFSRLYQLIMAENQPADIVPSSLFKLTLLDALKVYLVMYGLDALMFMLAGAGGLVLWFNRRRFFALLPAYTFWALIVMTFFAAVPLSLVGLDFRRLILIPLAISPFFIACLMWWWRQGWTPRLLVLRCLRGGLAVGTAIAAVLLFVIEFYVYQPMIPRSQTLNPDTPDEYSVWIHQVNTIYQWRMLTFAEDHAPQALRFNIDLLGNRQYIRYFGSARTRGLYMPLAPTSGWADTSSVHREKLFLLHWPGPAGGFGEQVPFRSKKNIAALRRVMGWGLVYDNGESFILDQP